MNKSWHSTAIFRRRRKKIFLIFEKECVQIKMDINNLEHSYDKKELEKEHLTNKFMGYISITD